MEFQYFRQEVATQTADRVLDVKRAFLRTLELGSDQGQVSKLLSPNAVSYHIQADSCPYVTYKADSNKHVRHDKSTIGSVFVCFMKMNLVLKLCTSIST